MRVVLVVAILNKFDDRGDVHNPEARLREIPPTLNELFDDILARDGSNENLLPIITMDPVFGTTFERRGTISRRHHFKTSAGRNNLTAGQKNRDWENTEELHPRKLKRIPPSKQLGF
jgi:hypothetical protein